MNGRQRRSRTERVRTDAGRVAIAAMVAAAAFAPVAGANGKGNGNGGGGNGGPPAHSNAGGNPPASQGNGPKGNNGTRAHGNSNGSRGNSGNAPGRAHGNPSPGTRPSQAPPSWSNAGGNGKGSGKPGGTSTPRGDNGGSSKEHDNNGAAHQKTTLCHATGSDTNPYVEITISDRAVKAHDHHQDGRDIIPAPAGGCPKAEVTAAVADAVAGLAPAFDAAIPGPPAGAAAPAGTADTPGSAVGGQTQLQPLATGDVAGVEASGGDPASGTAADPAARAAGESDDDSGSLPFTGLAVLMLAIAGALLLATGFGLRRSHTTRA